MGLDSKLTRYSNNGGRRDQVRCSAFQEKMLPKSMIANSSSRSPNKQDIWTTSRSSYRPDIDGLRGIAVTLVVLFHAFPRLLPGGFIGVDIFFVISGFLISSIIFQALSGNSFSFFSFYARRARRIFPCLLLVLLSCLVIGWFLLVADEYSRLGKHVFAATTFVSNFVLWSETGYFDTASGEKPLLHLWSLSIEEQFYLVWPWLITLMWKRALNHLALMFIVLVASFALNLIDISNDIIAAYYSPIGRFWELIAGACLAYHLSPALGRSNTFPYSNLAAAGGLFLLVAAILLVDQHSPFPGWYAMLPVLGTTLLIGAGNNNWISRWILSNRIIVGLGLISYPLYLWHWPILSFMEITLGHATKPEHRLFCVIAAIICAWLTYTLIERPYFVSLYKRRYIAVLIGCMAILGVFGFNIFQREGLPFRHEQLSAEKPAASTSYGFTSLGVPTTTDRESNSCNNLIPRQKKIDTFCHLTGPNPYLAVIGDSHANHLFFGLKRSSNVKLNQVLVVGAGACQPALQIGGSENCDEQSRANIEMIKSFKSIQAVIISADSAAIQKLTRSQYTVFLNGYLQLASELQSLGKEVLYVVDTPGFLESPVVCAPNPLPARNFFGRVDVNCEEIHVIKTRPRDVYNRFVSDFSAKNRAIRLIDGYSLFCNSSFCRVIHDNTLIFKDANHLTDYGSMLLSLEISSALK